MKAVFVYALAVLMLQGCASRSPQEQAKAKAALFEQMYGSDCQALGFKPDTQAYTDCKLKLHAAP